MSIMPQSWLCRRRGPALARWLAAGLPAVMALAGSFWPALAAAPFNGSFESGDTAGWVATVAPGGGAIVVAEGYTDTRSETTYGADGRFLALLRPGAPGSWTGLSQAFDVAEGQVIGCYTFVPAGEGAPQDYVAEERLLRDGAVVTTTFRSTAQDGRGRDEPLWQAWEYAPPAAGRYLFEARIRKTHAAVGDIYLGLDGCGVKEGEGEGEAAGDFTVQAAWGEAALSWQVPAGTAGTGFNVYRAAGRSLNEAGLFERANRILIGLPQEGDPDLPAITMTFTDTVPAGAYFYKLEAIGPDGESTTFGPERVTVAWPFRRPLRPPRLPAP